MIPSPQQEAVFRWVREGRGSLRLIAVAGAGKTTTLVEALKMMSGSVAMVAYNKAAATEIQSRLGSGVMNVRASTFHAVGFGAWMKAYPKCKMEGKKTQVLMDELGTPRPLRAFVAKATSLAKQAAFGILVPIADRQAWYGLVDHFDLEDTLAEDGVVLTDDLVATAIETSIGFLTESLARNPDMIDFDDMIHAPVYHNVRIWQNDWVLVDEAQDTNPIRRVLARRMLKPTGRLIAVGDPHQAIYGFTGADADALDLIAREFGCSDLPLTVTYRCPKAVVRHAKQWVSHIEAHESAPEGSVDTIPEQAFHQLTPEHLTARDAILCRNTKPLVELAYRLIRRGIPCHVEGRDIGQGLLALAGKWKTNSLSTLETKLDRYVEREVAKHMARGNETKAEAVVDKVDTLRVIMSALPPGSTVETLRDRINQLFSDTPDGKPSPNLTLSTVHKSKGREWDRVYLLGRNMYMPSKWARQEWQLAQEDNLCYVAVTRAKAVLIEVSV